MEKIATGNSTENYDSTLDIVENVTLEEIEPREEMICICLTEFE